MEEKIESRNGPNTYMNIFYEKSNFKIWWEKNGYFNKWGCLSGFPHGKQMYQIPFSLHTQKQILYRSHI